jgi:large subunit ribosomal protein L25
MPAPLEAGIAFLEEDETMSDLTTMDAATRQGTGKGAARATRREGFVPGVIYGDKQEPVLLKMAPRVLLAQLRKPGFFATQFKIHVDGQDHTVLARDVQFHPVTDEPLHIDFLRVTDRTKVTVEIHVQFVNEEESPGLKRGGVLNIVRHAVEVVTAAGSIPERLVADLASLDIGDAVKISDIDLAPGVTPTITDRDFTIATIAAPTAVRDEAAAEQEEAEAAAEGEVEEGEEEAAEAEAEEAGEAEEKPEE